jgi:hypothetical protein
MCKPKRAVDFRGLLFLCLCAAAANASANPYPYDGPYFADVEMSWSPGGTTAFLGSGIQNADPRNGKLLSTSVQVTIPMVITASGEMSQAGVVGRVDDEYRISIPDLRWNETFTGQTGIDAIGDPSPGNPIPFGPEEYQLPPVEAQGVRTGYPQFDVKNPSVYDFRLDAFGPGFGDLQITVTSALAEGPAGTIDSYQYHTKAQVTVLQDFEPWKINEMLAERINPQVVSGPYNGIQVNPIPWLDFSSRELASLNQYDHFNWVQYLVAFEDNGVFLDNVQLQNLIGRGFGLDPSHSTQLGKPFDNYDPVWNEVFVPFSTANMTPEANDGLSFRDYPNLLEPGRTAYFVTALVGVRADHSYDFLSDVFAASNGKQFQFRWKYMQTGKGKNEGNVLLFNPDSTLGGEGVAEFIGFGVPEPSSLVMAVVGGCLLGIALRRLPRRRG